MTLHLTIQPAKGARESATMNFCIETDGSIPSDTIAADLLAKVSAKSGPHRIARQTLLPGRPGKDSGNWGRLTRGHLTMFKSAAI